MMYLMWHHIVNFCHNAFLTIKQYYGGMWTVSIYVLDEFISIGMCTHNGAPNMMGFAGEKN